MELSNDFRVSVPVDEAWKVLTDVERIAPCLPGAQLQEVEGDEYRGIVKVKVGPITAQYKGAATFVERDDTNHRAVLRAEGRDTRGAGNASATITATLEPHETGTSVKVVTDLTVTGKVAQFGRGVLADVSAKLLKQFVECLEADLSSSGGTAAASTDEPAAAEADEVPDAAEGTGSKAATSGDAAGEGATAPTAEGPPAAPVGSNGSKTSSSPNGQASSGPRRIDSPEAEPVDIVAFTPDAIKRALPAIAALVVLLLVLRRRRK